MVSAKDLPKRQENNKGENVARKKLKTVLIFVQDETGSMSERAEPTVSAFNEYFNTLKKAKDLGEITVQIWQFSDSPGEDRVRLYHDGSLADVPHLDGAYRPRGVTPLLDAVGTAIKQAEAKKADRYLFIVQTDGLENASKDFSREQVAKLVAEKEKAKNWTLVFLGAGINEWTREAAAMGAMAYSSLSYAGDAHSTRGAYIAAASATANLLSSTSLSDKSMARKAQKIVDSQS